MENFEAGEHQAPFEADDERRRLLSLFLMRQRCQIDPKAATIGGYTRRSGAIGNNVTPGEIADALGVNRRWYELAERGEPARASAAILHSLGDVLGLNAHERAVLVQHATPCVDRERPLEHSLEVLAASSSMRRYLRKLYACSTTDETLNLVEDPAAAFFPEASCLLTAARLPEGGWSLRGEGIGPASRLRAFAEHSAEVIAPILASDPLAADDLMCFPQLSSPGELVTYDDYDETKLAGFLGKAYGRFRQLHEPMLAAVIRSRAGFVAHLYIGDFRTMYDNDTDRALVSAIADLASLAALAAAQA